MHACTGNDQISNPGKSIESFHLCSHFLSKPCDFCDSSGDQCSLGVVSISQSICCACRQSDHIFQCSSKFHSENIRCCIHPEYRAHKNTLKIICRFSCMCTHNTGCRNSLANFLCMTWSRKNSHISLRNLFFDHFTKCFQSFFFDALCHIDDLLSFPDIRRHFMCCASDIRGSYSQHCCICVPQCTFQVCHDLNLIRNHHTWKPTGIFSFFPEFPGIFRPCRPEKYFMAVIMQKESQSHPPAS